MGLIKLILKQIKKMSNKTLEERFAKFINKLSGEFKEIIAAHEEKVLDVINRENTGQTLKERLDSDEEDK
jgi:hypothetical protein